MMLGDKILNLRKNKGLSQEQLGEMVGVSRQTVSKWEIGQTVPELEKAILLAKVFEISIDELVNEKENVDNENSEISNDENKLAKISQKRKIIKIIMIIAIIIFIAYMSKVLYRYIVITEFQKTLNDINGDFSEKEEYHLNQIVIASEYSWQNTETEVDYYYKNGIEKRVYRNTMPYITDPLRVEYYADGYYYDIDYSTKTYNMKGPGEFLGSLDFKPGDYILQSEIQSNFEIDGRESRIKLAFDFNYNIGIEKGYYGGYYINNYGDNDNILEEGAMSAGCSLNGKRADMSRTFLDENTKAKWKVMNYTINVGDVKDYYVEFPDLTGFTLVEE